jgi:hypothetical protein
LPIDQRNNNKQKLFLMDRARYKELCRQRSVRVQKTYCCTRAGLVRLTTDSIRTSLNTSLGSHETASSCLETNKQLTSSMVRRHELSKLRGNRKEDLSTVSVGEEEVADVISSHPILVEDDQALEGQAVDE